VKEASRGEGGREGGERRRMGWGGEEGREKRVVLVISNCDC
jgi:hypothetical protein